MMDDQRQQPSVLLIEDDDRMIDVFVDWLAPLGIGVAVAKSKAAAAELIAGEYRLAVCDLQIPTHDGRLDAAAEHGLSVIARLRCERPDLPVLIFSGYNPSKLDDRTETAGLRFFNKSELPECLAEVKATVGIADLQRA